MGRSKAFALSVENSPDLFKVILLKNITKHQQIMQALFNLFGLFGQRTKCMLVEMRGNHIESGQGGEQCVSGQSDRPYFLEMVFWMKVQYLALITSSSSASLLHSPSASETPM